MSVYDYIMLSIVGFCIVIVLLAFIPVFLHHRRLRKEEFKKARRVQKRLGGTLDEAYAFTKLFQ